MNVLFWILLIVVLIAIFGGAFFAAAWWLAGYAVVGLIIGGLARLLVSNTMGLGLAATIFSGVAGAILGGWIAHLLDLGNVIELIVSVVVAAVVVAISAASSRPAT